MAPAHNIKGAHADMSQPNTHEAPPCSYTTRARLLVGMVSQSSSSEPVGAAGPVFPDAQLQPAAA
jgi:hypothetical protein